MFVKRRFASKKLAITKNQVLIFLNLRFRPKSWRVQYTSLNWTLFHCFMQLIYLVCKL